MRISNNQTIFIGENIKKENQIKEGQHKKEERTDFFAGNLNQDLFENKLLEKKKEAREKAMKVVGEAFDADKLIDNDLQERKNKIAGIFNKKYSSFEALSEVVVPLLLENKTLYEKYYLNSNRALWNKFELKVLANNKALKGILQNNLKRA